MLVIRVTGDLDQVSRLDLLQQAVRLVEPTTDTVCLDLSNATCTEGDSTAFLDALGAKLDRAGLGLCLRRPTAPFADAVTPPGDEPRRIISCESGPLRPDELQPRSVGRA